MTKYKKVDNNQMISVELEADTPYVRDERRLLNVGYLFLQKELYLLGFRKLAEVIADKYKLPYNFEKILADLVFSQVLDAESSKSAYEFCREVLLEMPNYEAPDVNNAINVIAQESELIVGTFCKNAKKLGEEIPVAGKNDISPCEIIAKMRSGSVLAKCCGTLKSEYKGDKEDLDEEFGLKAHGVVSFVAQLVLNQLKHKVNAVMAKAVNTKHLTETLGGMNILPLGKDGYIGRFDRTDLTDALHQLVDVRFDCMFITAGQVEKAVNASNRLTHQQSK